MESNQQHFKIEIHSHKTCCYCVFIISLSKIDEILNKLIRKLFFNHIFWITNIANPTSKFEMNSIRHKHNFPPYLLYKANKQAQASHHPLKSNLISVLSQRKLPRVISLKSIFYLCLQISSTFLQARNWFILYFSYERI